MRARLLLLALPLALVALLVWRALLPDYGRMDDAARAARVLAMYAEYAREFPEVSGISAAEAVAAFEEGSAVFIDVREPGEQAVSTIPEALTPDGFLAALAADPTRFAGKTAIAYCTISYRSGVLAADWQRQGGVAVRNLEGGLLAWLHAGGPLAGPDGTPTSRVHVFGATWDLAPRAVATVY